MKKVININFQGRVVMIEEEAYEELKSYIESLRRHFANEEGSDEIINDIENRISELFAEVIKKGNPCVSESDLEAIIHSIGRPEDLEDEETATASSSQQQSSETRSQQAFQQTNTSGQKQFFRDETNKKIGGVCAGIANYFNIDPTVVRLIALILLIIYGVGLIPYIILWIAVPSSATQVIGSTHKRFYRDLSHKTIGGVCSGIANYFSISLWIPKVIFLIGAFCSFPLSIAFGIIHHGNFFFPGMNGFFITLYIILWAVVPAAVTASDKLSMKGKNVDLNNIKDTVQEDLSDGKKKVNNMKTSSAPELIPVRERSTLGNIIVTLLKVFAYFILGCILIGVICGLFAIGIAMFGLYPLKGYIIGGTWQNTLAIIAFILVVWLPIVGIIIWIIRSITHTKSNRYLRMTFVGLWLAGLISLIGLIGSVWDDVREVNNPVEQAVTLTNPMVQKLEINYIRENRPYRFSRNWMFGRSSYSVQTTRTYYHRHTIFDDFVSSIKDSVLLNNTSLHFVPSLNDSFAVDITKLSNGSSVANANLLAERINYSGIAQQDSVLNIPSYFTLNTTDKFRNQFVVITVAVPLGKKIIVHQNDGYANEIDLGFQDFYDNNDDSYLSYSHRKNMQFDEEYVMTKDGLKRTHVDTDDDDNDNDENTLSEQKLQEQQQKLNEQKERLRQQNEEKKHKLQEQIQQLKKDSEKINTISANFEMPAVLVGKAFLKMI
ncbi:hypothetical protein A9P82_05400 [Arachidicoccus ginsenosidimutans]|uniref:PspC domain-containing protein n=1 Tax=Arachidicoccus sp. BS20 TaxID=1850526 RepID=UPI0007F05B45|nr:PspC domain-containing protein [Arachidicoccus sp. BS20]ANI88772.1 hypothetical protein A9P82_05400 [Arachidicoccus sp. BS20]